ncbi:nucleoporin NUP35-like isoform X2 [Panulirus ornatus]|uniref:nucleoporin NUP35-like isoform X2 n=1 Tax=Panulirus ornatus TaxID=150431 RepID=UPI003A85F27B
MEPMSLGSPVGSPAAPSHTTPVSTAASTYLPSFLMGASPSTSTGRGGGASPNKTTRQFSTSTSVSTPGSPQPTKDPFFSSRLGPDKPGGPPTQSLMGIRGPPAVPQSPIPPARLGSPYVDHRILGAPAGGYLSPVTPSGYSTPGSPVVSTSQSAYNSAIFTPSKEYSSFIGQDSLQVSASDSLEDTWVTVFGFPPAAASYILTQFTQLGTITEHHNPGSGNWMHLKYQTITGDKENMSANLSSIMSPNNSSMISTPRANMRPLTQAYQTAHAEHEVVPKVSTPKKNDSLVSRAMQHILGL